MKLEQKVRDLTEDVDRFPAWRPRLLDLGRPDDRRAFEALLEGGSVDAVCDTLRLQLGELCANRSASRKLAPEEIEAQIDAHLGGAPILEHGTWVHYPWLRRLVHVLPEAELRELRHARNRYKIKPDEQETLAGKTIGVVGLSVGMATALTLAQEGVGRSFRLADFDTLSLSNMNRLRTSLTAIGLPKVVIAARAMFEMDPYLAIELWPEGLTEETTDAFLLRGGKLDLVVEECDALFIKIFVRERARAHGVPVVMDTNERGMVDVERFDLDPDRPVLHGLLAGVRAHDVKGLSTRDKVPYVLRILGQNPTSARFVPSLMEIDETISSWPQLASGVELGAAAVTDVARRILLDHFRGSGRYYVDLDAIIREGREAELAPPAPLDAPLTPSTLAPPVAPLPAVSGAVSREDLRRLVALGTLAPSGGNVQPWRFRARGTTVRCLVDAERPPVLLDFQRHATFLSIGAAVENMDLAAGAAGLRCEVRPFPEPGSRDLVCEATFSIAERRGDPSPLAQHITARATNRKLARRAPLPPEAQRALEAAAASGGGRLQVLTDPAGLDAMGNLLGAGDRVRFLSRRMHAEMMGEVRWDPREVEETRDGIDVVTLEMSRTDLAGMRLARKYESLAFLREIGGGRALERSSRLSVGAASAMCALSMPGTGPESYFRGGRALQRVWLTATALGLAMQPMSAIVYLWTRLERGGGEGLDGPEIQTLRELRARYKELFDVAPDEAEIMLFRVAVADPPTARSLRRPVDEVLTFED